MRGRNDFVMDTKGYCLLCLNYSPTRHPPGAFGEFDEDISSKVFSLQRVCHYLRLNMRNVFKDLIAAAPKMTSSSSSASVLEKSELKGVLCEECSEMTETFSEITLELEILQMTLNSLVKTMRDKVEGVGRNRELLEGFKREMLSGPQTLIHYGIVEQLRKETLRKCSLMMERTQPRVIVEKLGFGIIDLQNLDGGSQSPLPPSPSGLDVDAPELREATPVISSVRGSYHVDDSYPGSTPKSSASIISSNPDIGMEPKPSIGVIDPEAPIPIKIEREIPMEDEEDVDDPIFPHVVLVSSTALHSPEVPSPPGSPNARKECKYCHQSFCYVCQRVDHERVVHEGILFECGICSTSFHTRSTRNKHRRQVHKVSLRPRRASEKVQKTDSAALPNKLSEPSKSKPSGRKRVPKLFGNKMGTAHFRHKCEYCPRRFRHTSNKSRHMKNAHNHITIRQRRQLRISAQGAQSETSMTNDNFHLQIGDLDRVEVQTGSEEIPDPDINTLSGDKQEQGSASDKKDSRKECKYCHKSFMFACLRVDHERTIHEGILFECGMCPSTFKYRSMRNRHRQTAHNLSVRKDKSTPNSDSLNRSLRTQVKQKMISAVAAAASSPHPDKAPAPAIHPVRHGLKFQCPLCPLSYKSQGALNMHRYRKHIDTYQPVRRGRKKRKFRCDYCPMKFSQKGNRLRHMRTVHNHPDSTQDDHFQTSSNDNLHLQIGEMERVEVEVEINEGTGQVVADFLSEDKQGSSQAQNIAVPDMKTASGAVKRHKCQHCTMRFRYTTGLRNHQAKAHPHLATTEKKFKCETCGKRFVRAYHLTVHQKITHKGIKYLCQYCSTEFRKLGAMRNHMKKYCSKRFEHIEEEETGSSERSEGQETEQNNEQQPEDDAADQSHGRQDPESEEDANEVAPPEPGWYKCQYCGKQFNRFKGLKQHLTMAHLSHTVVRKYKCDLCPKRFILKTHLGRHRRMSHYD